MKVNMTPNPLDVVTIHASQGDTEARQWEFELHNNGELIDTSDVKEQLVFKAYKGGTEQLLPENGSTPTTSPFKGDIRYPQGLLTDQEFTYRQSPTEEDGLAKIQTIYGNTIKWNQLIREDANTKTLQGVTFTKNDDGSYTITGTPTGHNVFVNLDYVVNTNYLTVGHKYLLKKGTTDSRRIGLGFFGAQEDFYSIDGDRIFTVTSLSATSWARMQVSNLDGIDLGTVKIYPQLFDLTELGIADKTDTEILEWFSSNYPLPYYQYDSGSLLPFRGDGLKTVGKNLLDKTSFSENTNAKPEQTSTGVKVISKNGASYGYVRTMVISNLTSFIGKTFILSADVQTSNNSGLALQVRDENNAEKAWRITYTTGPASVSLAITDDFRNCHLNVYIYAIGSSGAADDYSIYDDLQLEFGTSATSYEPYTTSTLSLPISTYFPTGMKSAGNVYDELTPMKAVTRIGSIDMGTLEWVLSNPSANIFAAQIDIKEPSDYEARKTGFINPKYPPSSGFSISPSMDDKSMLRLGGQIFIRDTAFSDVTALKTSLNGVYLYYELATETETSFTTASLVTENAEIPLSNEDGVLIGKCTEQLSENPGFIDAKIKLSDADGTCYSNKLQLHVERSPQ